MKTTRILHLCCLLAALSLGKAWAQGSSEYKAGIKIPLDQEGKKYIRFITWNQMWVRSIQNNPGTASVSDPTQRDNQVWDIGVRRARALWYAQITPRYLVLTHIGINNQTFASGGLNTAAYSSGTAAFGGNNKKPQLFLHDFWNEYRVFRTDKESADGKTKTENNSLYIGAGLHYWHGVSRMASASTLNFLAVDAPVWNWYNIEVTDQFARQFGIYAKGKIATHLDYRAYLNKPFMVDQRASAKTFAWTSTASPENNRAGYAPTDKFSYGGYFNWQFWDQESNLLPFTVGSYEGTKKVFNLGFGFNQHPDALVSYQRADTVGAAPNTFVATDSARYSQTNWGIDAFLDMPLGEGGKAGAITAYLLYQNNNYGPNFYRSVGIMPISSGFATATGQAPSADERSIDGSGNNRPFLGTGDLVYVQAGYLLPKDFAGEKFGALCRIQPFATYTLKNMDYLGTSTNYFDAGCNFLMDGHHSKITVQYSTRPLVTGSAAMGGTRTVSGNNGEFIIQAQVYL